MDKIYRKLSTCSLNTTYSKGEQEEIQYVADHLKNFISFEWQNINFMELTDLPNEIYNVIGTELKAGSQNPGQGKLVSSYVRGLNICNKSDTFRTLMLTHV